MVAKASAANDVYQSHVDTRVAMEKKIEEMRAKQKEELAERQRKLDNQTAQTIKDNAVEYERRQNETAAAVNASDQRVFNYIDATAAWKENDKNRTAGEMEKIAEEMDKWTEA